MTGRDGAATRCGFTVMETLVALLLGLLITSLVLSTLVRQRSAQLRLARRAETLSALRTARHVLERALRTTGPDDVEWPPAGDSLGLRVYRGVALVCREEGTSGELLVRWDGTRAPEVEKDSVWILGETGEGRVLALLEVQEGGACPRGPGGPASRWTLSAPLLDRPVMALYFERGSYHLSGNALRYRRGEGGRQPLTPEALLTPPSGFQRWGDELVASLVTEGGAERVGKGMSAVPAPRERGGG